MQFSFVPGRGTSDAIFILRQLQEKHLAKNKILYFAFLLEKTFDRVPRRVIWLFGLDEWIITLIAQKVKYALITFHSAITFHQLLSWKNLGKIV